MATIAFIGAGSFGFTRSLIRDILTYPLLGDATLALMGNPRLVFQAIAYDPLTAAVLSLAEIRQRVNALFEKNRDHLPQFKKCVV